MLLIQKYHSIHEIEPEFIQNIEMLLQEEVANFDTLVQRHDRAPASDVFTYFLFFGPTQNAPVGIAQLSLKQIPWKKYLPWWRRLLFWRKEHLQWKHLTWQMGDGSHGLCIFDPRFARAGKEKIQELIKEYNARKDVMSQSLYTIKGLQDFDSVRDEDPKLVRESHVLEPLTKAQKSYKDYLESLGPEVRGQIKEGWKKLHKNLSIKLGEYLLPAETPANLPIEAELLKIWASWGAQVLTFEKDDSILGCLLLLKGNGGNVFFEPFVFEQEGTPLVSEELYTQYALLKFFEMQQARKCHLMKFGNKLVFDDRSDLTFFVEQGFKQKTITHTFYSRLKGLEAPL
jgi:hypothetical protein